MPKAVVAGLIMVVSLASAGFSDDRDASQSGLDRLKSFGYIVTDDGIEEHSPRFVVPHNSTVTPAAIEELLQYCIAAAPAAEVVFLSPAIVEEQLRQFRQFLPHAHIRHASAVWFGAHFLVCLPDGINDVCRIEGFDRGAPAAEWGLQKGDIILGIGEFRWPEAKSLDSFSFAIKRQVPGEKSTITVKRDNEILSFPVTWRTLPQSKNPLLRSQ